MANTEKPQTIAQKKQMTGGDLKNNKEEIKIKTAPVKKEGKVEVKKEDKKVVQKKIKRDEAIAKGYSVPVSTKDAIAICRFIKYKRIGKAIDELEDVMKFRKAIPMRGEIPHRKGLGKVGSGSGRFPIKASKHFVNILRSLKANSIENGLENPMIALAIANTASRPMGKAGRVKKKRTHIQLVAKEKKELNKISKEKTLKKK